MSCRRALALDGNEGNRAGTGMRWRREVARPTGPLIGYALEFKNRSLGFEHFGSPQEIVEVVRELGLSLPDLVNHRDTGIRSVEVFKVAPDISFSGGEHADTILEILEALDDRDLGRVASALSDDPSALTAKGAAGAIPLLAAVAAGSVDAVKLLLKAGAKVDNVAHLGMAPLHWAAAFGNCEVVTALLGAGANGQRYSWFFVTPRELAGLNGAQDTEIAMDRFGLGSEGPVSAKVILRRMAKALSDGT